MTRIPRWFLLLAVVTVVVLLTGVGLSVWGLRSATFGWFAYAPLADDTFVPEVARGLTLQRAGHVLIAVGLLGSGFVAGLLVGRRQARP